jgi:cytochrome P450
LLNNAFAEGALKNLEKYVLANIRDWCNYLGESKDSDEKESGWGKERDLGLWATLLTFDVLGDLCFGSSFGAMKNGFTYIQELIMSSSSFQQSVSVRSIPTNEHYLTFRTQVSFLPIRELVFPLMKPKILLLTGSKNIKQKVMYRQRIGVLVQKRFALENANADKSDEDQRKDFFHHLLNAKDPETGEKFKPTDLVGEAALLVGAGADTSSTAMSGCFFYLMRTPRALSRLQEQVRSAFGDVEEIKYGAKLTSLSYLRGCIDEAMRMSPPVPGLLDRLVLPGGADIDGHTIPEGMVVGVPIYTIHHNEKYYPRPYEFLPERWIAGSDSSVAGFDVTPESVEIARSAFNAFSTGPRNCVGKNMAYMELFVAIARTIWLFDIRLKEGDHTGEGGPGLGLGREKPGEYQLKDWLISERHGPVLEFRKRTIS